MYCVLIDTNNDAFSDSKHILDQDNSLNDLMDDRNYWVLELHIVSPSFASGLISVKHLFRQPRIYLKKLIPSLPGNAC